MRTPSFARGLTFRRIFVAFCIALCGLSAFAGSLYGSRLVKRAATTAAAIAGPKSGTAKAAALTALVRTLQPLKASLAFGFGFVALATALACLFLFRRLVLDRLDAVVDHLRRGARSPESSAKLGRLKPGAFDPKEVVTLISAVNDGLAELALRNRIRALSKQTAENLAKVGEDEFLQAACGLLKSASDVSDARAYIVRADARAADGYLIELQSEKKEPERSYAVNAGVQGQIQALLSQGNLSEMRSDAVIAFAKEGAALEWVGASIFHRTPLTPNGEVSLVTVVTPEAKIALSGLQFEHLCAAWASEVARAWHQIRFQDLTSSLEISAQLQRKWVESDAGTWARDPSSEGVSAGECVGYENLPSRFVNGDFLCVFRLEKRNVSIVILGDVTGHDLRAGLAATGCVAALSDRFSVLCNAAPHVVLDGLMQSMNRYMWASHRGALGLRTLGISFNHEYGQGSLCCFGQPFPYLLSPSERKPMVLLPAVNPGMMGISDAIDSTSTPFSLLQGQILFTCTEGILATEDLRGKRFDKMIQRGVLSDVFQQNPACGAPALLASFLDAVRAHAAGTSLRNDLTAVILKVTSPTH